MTAFHFDPHPSAPVSTGDGGLDRHVFVDGRSAILSTMDGLPTRLVFMDGPADQTARRG